MQGARLPLASSGASVRDVPREAESRRVGEESLLLAAPVPHWRLAFVLAFECGYSGGQLAFVSIFVGGWKLSALSLLGLEGKMFLPVFWKLQLHKWHQAVVQAGCLFVLSCWKNVLLSVP